jgi:DNA-binding cell septation regulator SpoVG
MAADIVVSDVKIRFRGEKGGPLLGWASCVLNGGVLINSIEIKRGQGGDLFLSYPSRRSRGGIAHPYFCPVDRAVGEMIRDAILGKLGDAARGNGG